MPHQLQDLGRTVMLLRIVKGLLGKGPNVPSQVGCIKSPTGRKNEGSGLRTGGNLNSEGVREGMFGYNIIHIFLGQ